MKLVFSGQIFEKYLNMKFQESPSCGSRVVPWTCTDRHDEANSRLSQFFERGWKRSSQRQDMSAVICTGLVGLHGDRCEHDVQSCKFLKDLLCASLLN